MDRLATPDLERALPLLVDAADLTQGGAAEAIIVDAVASVGEEPRRRALVFALASDNTFGVRSGRRAAAAEAISCAEQAGDVAIAALHRALVNLVVDKVAAAEGLDTALLDRAASLESKLPALRLHDTADLHRGIWSRFIEDVTTARASLRRSIARAREIGDDYAQWIFLSYLAAAEELAGDYAAAAAALEAADAGARWHDWPLSPWHVEPRCELLIAAGDLDLALTMAGEHMPDDAPKAAARFKGACIRGKVAAWRGDPTAAAAHFERAAGYADQFEWADPGIRDRLDVPLAEAYVGVGRLSEAAQISSWLRGVGERMGRPTLIGDASRVDALVNAADSDLNAAAAAARAAVTAHESSPLRGELARSLLVLGRIERRRKARRESRAALARARDLAAAMGHRPLLAEIERELPRIAPTRSGHELTTTERRVADLIARGATNKDTAAALFISVRTVETHVASIYRKLGVRTRAELARQLARHPADTGPEA
jgi:DNA-binding CsgD family transcriptional regulator